MKGRGFTETFPSINILSVITRFIFGHWVVIYNAIITRGARWLSGRVWDSGARGRGFETYHRHVVSLSKTLYSPKVLVNYLGSGGSSRHDWKIVDWDVKPQHKQTNHYSRKEVNSYLVFLLSEKICSLPSCLFCQQPQQLLRRQILWNLLFVDTFCCKTELKSCFWLFMWCCIKMASCDVT